MKYRPQIPLSLCLIVKNEAENIRRFARALTWLTHPEDEVVIVDTGSTDGTQAMVKKRLPRAQVIDRSDLQSTELVELVQKLLPQDFKQYAQHGHFKDGILSSFATARNTGYAAAKNEHIVWLDLDDELVNGELLRKVVDAVFENGRRGALFLKYEYTLNQNGEVTTTLWRERVTTKGDFTWKGHCHETLIPQTDKQIVYARDPACPVVVRHVAAKEHQFSDLRNYAILYKAHHIDKDNDPRTLFYLGNAARGLGLNGEAITYYREFCPISGNPDDIMAAKLGTAGAYAGLGMFLSGIKACADATSINPSDPRPHYLAANIWVNLENWHNTIQEVKLGDALSMPDTLHAMEPHTFEYQPAAMLATAYRELSMPEKALEAARRAAAARPDCPEIQETLRDYTQWAMAEKTMQDTMQVLRYATNPEEAIKHLRISPHMLQVGFGVPETAAPGDPAKRSIAFWCGTSIEPWGPPSMVQGIGASEKMVYDVARALAKRDWNVQVYCSLNCPEGEYDGVNWMHVGHFNPRLHRDIVVVWRMPQVLDQIPFCADKVYVWMHDVGTNSVWTPERLPLVDKVLFLSDFQRRLHPAVPDEKVFITRNGIDLARQLYAGETKEKKIVFCSSPDRGFISAVRAFRESQLERDGWALHLFYGFGKTWRKMVSSMRFIHIPDLGVDCDAYQYQDLCASAADGRSVVNRGRVGWDKMASEMKSSRIWLYPTVFDEISCVSAMEAMAAGNALVTTMHGALRETCADYDALWDVGKTRDGKANIEQAAKDLRDAASAVLNPAALAEHARRFDIEALVENWCKELFA